MKNLFINIVEKINIRICIGAFIIFVMLPILYISFFSFPMVDDYEFGLRAKEIVATENANLFSVLKGAFDTTIDTYLNWQGMYGATFFSAVHPGVFGEQYYFLTTWILLVVSLIAFLFFGIKLLSLLNVDKKTACFLSFILWFFYIQTMPNPREGLFWFNGGIAYVGFFSLALINVTLLISNYNKDTKISAIVATSILGFIVSGGNVLTALCHLLVIILLILYILFFENDKKKSKPVFIAFIFSLIGFLLVCFAPGNAVRQAAIADAPTIIETIIKVGLFSYFEFVFLEWISLSLLLFLVFLTPFVVSITKNLTGFKVSKLVLLIIVQYMLICAMLCAPYYGMGEAGFFGGGKAINIVYPVFIIAVVVIYGYFIGLLQQKNIVLINLDKIPSFNKKMIGIATSLVVFLGIFFYGSNYYWYSTSGLAFAEIRGGVTATFNQQMEQRLEVFYDDSIQNVVLEPHIYSIFYGYERLSENSVDWPNTSVAEYYGKLSVAITTE